MLLYTPAYKEWNWDPPFKAGRFTISVFFLSNVFLLVVPLIPPTTTKVYRTLPYWVSTCPLSATSAPISDTILLEPSSRIGRLVNCWVYLLVSLVEVAA